jgi:hypothetical protein
VASSSASRVTASTTQAAPAGPWLRSRPTNGSSTRCEWLRHQDARPWPRPAERAGHSVVEKLRIVTTSTSSECAAHLHAWMFSELALSRAHALTPRKARTGECKLFLVARRTA